MLFPLLGATCEGIPLSGDVSTQSQPSGHPCVPRPWLAMASTTTNPRHSNWREDERTRSPPRRRERQPRHDIAHEAVAVTFPWAWGTHETNDPIPTGTSSSQLGLRTGTSLQEDDWVRLLIDDYAQEHGVPRGSIGRVEVTPGRIPGFVLVAWPKICFLIEMRLVEPCFLVVERPRHRVPIALPP